MNVCNHVKLYSLNNPINITCLHHILYSVQCTVYIVVYDIVVYYLYCIIQCIRVHIYIVYIRHIHYIMYNFYCKCTTSLTILYDVRYILLIDCTLVDIIHTRCDVTRIRIIIIISIICIHTN